MVFDFFSFYSNLEIDDDPSPLRFNIWHTGADPNFDRIVHLVKLVFNTKCVVISLMDEHEQCVYPSFFMAYLTLLFCGILGGSNRSVSLSLM